MPSPHRSQKTLKGHAVRPSEERRPAGGRLHEQRLPERPSAAKAAHRMLRHWPSKGRRPQLTRRPA